MEDICAIWVNCSGLSLVTAAQMHRLLTGGASGERCTQSITAANCLAIDVCPFWCLPIVIGTLAMLRMLDLYLIDWICHLLGGAFLSWLVFCMILRLLQLKHRALLSCLGLDHHHFVGAPKAKWNSNYTLLGTIYCTLLEWGSQAWRADTDPISFSLFTLSMDMRPFCSTQRITIPENPRALCFIQLNCKL